jgi:hypothetical protein
MSGQGTGFVRDEREERLQRAGYLLVVYVDGLFCTSAALVLAVCRWAKKQAVALVAGSRPTGKQSGKLGAASASTQKHDLMGEGSHGGHQWGEDRKVHRP